MEIPDEGKGFAVDGAPTGGYNERLGFLGMQERIEMEGGSFSLTSAPGKKTTLIADVPLEHAGTRRSGAERDSLSTAKT